MSQNYFYDAQIRRYIIQVARIFGGFSYATLDSTGKTVYKKVPFVYAASNSQVQAILNNNSENTTVTLPIFAIYISSIKQNHQRRQDPSYVNRQNVTERAVKDGKYTDQPGNKYTVEMLMPVMYDMQVRVDLISTNESEKWQILEQILVLFNPEVELQTSTNAVDWTALSTVTLTDINLTPAANNSSINDLTTLTFNVPIYINPPSKVKRSSLIREIVLNIGNLSGYKDTVDSDGEKFENGEIMHTSVVTPDNLYLNVKRVYTNKNVYSLTLNKDLAGTPSEVTWVELFAQYGEFINNSSLLYLLQNITSYDKNKNVYVGKLNIVPSDPTTYILTIDPNTLPHTQYPNNVISGVIDPNKVNFNNSTSLQVGDSYLLLNHINPNTVEWGNIYYNNVANAYGNYAANENDIITWDGTKWNITFSAENSKDEEVFYTNKLNGDYLTWADGLWRMSIEAIYAPGYWKLDL